MENDYESLKLENQLCFPHINKNFVLCQKRD